MKVVALNEPRTRGFDRSFRCLLLLWLALIVSTVGLSATQRKKHQHDTPQDQIEVVSHLPLTDGMITRFLTTEHYRRNYLYAEHQAGEAVTLIDVTNIKQPSSLGPVSYSEAGVRIVAVTGTAALVSANSNAPVVATSPQTFRIMSFADPLHPTVKQEFVGVTAMARDDMRSLIFLANPQGLWILQQQRAIDPQEEREWEHMMLDNR